PSSRCLMHRRLRLPHSRASSAFPPTPSILPPTGSPTRRFPPEGKSQCDLSATTPRLSRRFALSLPMRSLEHFHVAPAAGACDTVVLTEAELQREAGAEGAGRLVLADVGEEDPGAQVDEAGERVAEAEAERIL